MEKRRIGSLILMVVIALIAIEVIRTSPDRNTIFPAGLAEDLFRRINVGTSAVDVENRLGKPLFTANDGKARDLLALFAPQNTPNHMVRHIVIDRASGTVTKINRHRGWDYSAYLGSGGKL